LFEREKPLVNQQQFSHRWLGIDFSGDHLKWRAHCRTSNVWIADVRESGGQLYLDDTYQVQKLEGNDDIPPFTRLVNLLQNAEYDAAGIDAPFSIPDKYVPDNNHKALLTHVGTIEKLPGRPFPDGTTFVRSITGLEPPLYPPKPLRDTDAFWHKKVNIRSTLWAGARGGAPMTSACLTLLHLANRPMWPWDSGNSACLLVEAFPAGQLYEWGVIHQQYNGDKEPAIQNRKTILNHLRKLLVVPKEFSLMLEGNADALDSVICAFAAIAVTKAQVAHCPQPASATEGWICVHS
jgi:hypothetical protein